MARYRTTVHSPADTATAYAYLADFTSILEWDPTVRAAELIGGQPGALGSRYRVVVGLPLFSIPLEYEIVDAAAPVQGGPASVALRAENADFVSYDVITFAPAAEGGTDVTYDANLSMKGFRRLFDLGSGLVMQVIGARARSGLVRSLGALPADRAA